MKIKNIIYQVIMKKRINTNKKFNTYVNKLN